MLQSFELTGWVPQPKGVRGSCKGYWAIMEGNLSWLLIVNVYQGPYNKLNPLNCFIFLQVMLPEHAERGVTRKPTIVF